MTNPWNQIPLNDYEQHMQHQTVGQAQLLTALTNRYLHKYRPEYPLFLGISGGNGLEHIDVNQVKQVCAIDINGSYLEQTRQRFGATIPQLALVHADIGLSTDSFIEADWVWAALVFEYIDLAAGFAFISRNTSKGAKLLITIQSNNGVQSVSQTGIESIKSVGAIFNMVDRERLKRTGVAYGFDQIGEEENFLPNGKSLVTYAFSKGTAPAGDSVG